MEEIKAIMDEFNYIRDTKMYPLLRELKELNKGDRIDRGFIIAFDPTISMAYNQLNTVNPADVTTVREIERFTLYLARFETLVERLEKNLHHVQKFTSYREYLEYVRK